ncbi:MAG: butyrate kinase [Candidatus Delongbacteria bacterium]|nr:butyrate kinase [Candidatus Delongbacteria bacterium]
MKSHFYILAINPGSTSTKIAIFKNEELVFKQNIYHNDQEIASFERTWDQYAYRKKEIIEFIREKNFDMKQLSCVVGRGGLFRPVISGTYQINENTLEDAREAVQGDHASNLGCILAYGIAWDFNIPSYIVDPPSVDEMEAVARISGHVKIKRRSLLHALNIKAMARSAAQELKRPLNDLNLIVAHMGGGISITPIRHGRMIDTNNALSGGPFSAERTGNLPMMDILEYIFDNNLSLKESKKLVMGNGGMVSYIGTKSMIDAAERYEKGDSRAQLVIHAMAYQISKEIGAMATTLNGAIDAIILTGGAAFCNILVSLIQERIGFLGRIILLPGEDEMIALAQGALRVLRGEEQPLVYPTQIEYEELF